MAHSRMNISHYGLPRVRNAWGTPPPSVGHVGTGSRQALPDARPSVGRVRPGYRHAFSEARPSAERVQTGYRQPAQRVRPVDSGSVERFRRMINDPGLKGLAFSRKLEQETDEMELWLEDHKQKSLRMQVEKKKSEQDKEIDIFKRIYMRDMPTFQHNAQLQAENDALKKQIQQISEVLEEDLQCPISHAVFRDPVMIRDGHTYEREHIEAWFAAGNTTSPMTRETIRRPRLVPNIIVKKMVDALALN